MRKRKIQFVVLALCMISLFLTACQTSSKDSKGNEKESSGQKDGALNIFYTNAILTAPYCAVQQEAMQKYADENNINLQSVDGKEDAQTQLDQIKNAVTQGVDGIIYFPGDQASTIPVVRYLNESGVPFIVLNSKVDESVEELVPSYVGSDYEAMGGIAGEIAADILKENGGNVAIINGLLGTEVQLSTYEGFNKAISGNSKIKIIAEQAADWDTAKAMTVMEDYLTTFGEEIDLVFAMDSGMTKGAVSAMQDAGVYGDIPIVTSDQGQFVLDAIASGDIKGTAKQDPQEEGELALKTVVKLINGESVEKWVKLPTEIIDQSNVGQYVGY